jgi:epoxyqueuosine reductase
MRVVEEPTYKKYIVGKIKRFDDRNSGFSRGMVDPSGSKYDLMHQRSVENIRKKIRGKSILDHALWVAGRTVDYTMRRNHMARELGPLFNREIKLEGYSPIETSRIIKRVARWLGADLVGIAKLNPLWIYSHWGSHAVHYTGAAKAGDPIEIPESYQYVIVMIHEMGYEWVKRSPAVEPETDRAYSMMGWSAGSLATFIRELGFKAIPSGNELGLSIPMAIDAGLGELSRMGLLMTREFGPRCRISKVFTDLPVEVDQPIDIGVQGFCEKCEQCARHCPSQAIKSGERTDQPWDQSNNPGMLKWPIHAMRCLDWWAKNGTHCSVCIRVCPWNKVTKGVHKAVRFLAERNMMTRMLVSMDEWMGYGKQEIREIG